MSLVGNADKDGTINSDLAFWGNLAYAGNYGGFRILDISGDQPQTDHRPRVQRPAERRLGLRDGRQAVPVPVDRLRPDRRGLLERRRRRSSTGAHRLRGRARLRRDEPDGAEVPGHDPDGVRLAHAHAGAGRQPRVHLRRVLSARHRHHRADGARRLPRVRAAAQEDLDHRGQRDGRQLLVQPAREVAQRRHGVQPRLPGLPRRPGVPAEEPRGRRLRGRRSAVGRLRSGQPDDEQRGAAHPHQEPVSGRSVRVHPLGHRVVGRQDVRDHGRDRRRRRGVVQRRGVAGRLLLLLRRGGARRSGAERCAPGSRSRGRRVRRSASRTTRT